MRARAGARGVIVVMPARGPLTAHRRATYVRTTQAHTHKHTHTHTHTHTHAHTQVAHYFQNGDMYGETPGTIRPEHMTQAVWDFIFLRG